MEINAANVAWHKSFWEANLCAAEKGNLVSYLQKKYKKITVNAIPVTTKKAIKFGTRIFSGTYPLSFP